MKKILYTALAAFTFVLFSGCSEDLDYLKRENNFLGSQGGTIVIDNEQLQAVDLGLSVKWADRLLSNTYSSEYRKNEKYYYQRYNFGAQSSELRQEGLAKGSISGTRYDNARIYGDSNWRTPTKEQFEELIEKCSFKIDEETYNGSTYRGMRVTGPNGNSVFIRAEKNDSHQINLWTSSYYSEYSNNFYGYYYEFTLYEVKGTVEATVRSTNSCLDNGYARPYYGGYAIWPVQN